jgi:hypothetical protein
MSPIPVEYGLMLGDRGWAVFDVIVDGVSLARSHRAQLDRILQRASSNTLLQVLNSKVEKESSERATRLRATLAGQGRLSTTGRRTPCMQGEAPISPSRYTSTS